MMRGKAANAKAEEGQRTRQQLLDVAEALFAEHGVAAVSLRSVTTAAGLATGAVHYHFGAKEELLAAVVARRGTGVLERMDQLIGAVEASRAKPSARALIDTMAIPLLEVFERDGDAGLRWLKVIAGLTQMRDPAVLAGTRRLEERLDAQLQRAFPGADLVALRRTWRIASVMLVRMLGDIDTPGAHLPGDDERQASASFVDAALEFCAAGLRAAGR
jgi:AcrR family transcriptional regulator